MTKVKTVKILLALALAPVATLLVACDPEYSPHREPYMAVTSPPRVHIKQLGEDDDSVTVYDTPVDQPRHEPGTAPLVHEHTVRTYDDVVIDQSYPAPHSR